jgi:hypothetical protein
MAAEAIAMNIEGSLKCWSAHRAETPGDIRKGYLERDNIPASVSLLTTAMLPECDKQLCGAHTARAPGCAHRRHLVAAYRWLHEIAREFAVVPAIRHPWHAMDSEPATRARLQESEPADHQ